VATASSFAFDDVEYTVVPRFCRDMYLREPDPLPSLSSRARERCDDEGLGQHLGGCQASVGPFHTGPPALAASVSTASW
jgi:hypothetical protein